MINFEGEGHFFSHIRPSSCTQNIMPNTVTSPVPMIFMEVNARMLIFIMYQALSKSTIFTHISSKAKAKGSKASKKTDFYPKMFENNQS